MNDLETAKLQINVHVLEMLVVTLLTRAAVKDGEHLDDIHTAIVDAITNTLSKSEPTSSSQDALRVEALYTSALDRIFLQARAQAQRLGMPPQ